MEQINKKVERYIKLSKQFGKTSIDIFGKESDSSSDIILGYTTSTASYINAIGQDYSNKEVLIDKSRAEKIREAAEIKAKLAEDYDEYLQLQKELGDYFTSLNKLTNK